MKKISGIDYKKGVVPKDYRCDACGAHGVKLWCESEILVDYTTLLCFSCIVAILPAKKVININTQGKYKDEHEDWIDQIGFYNPAIPVEGKNTYWQHSMVPEDGIRW